MNHKRERTDSLEFDDIPGFRYVKRSKSNSPSPVDLSRRQTRGVESISLEPNLDRLVVLQGLISALNREGKRVVTDPRLLLNSQGHHDLTVEWILDHEVKRKVEDEEPTSLQGSNAHFSTSGGHELAPNEWKIENSALDLSQTHGHSNRLGATLLNGTGASGTGSADDPFTFEDDERELTIEPPRQESMDTDLGVDKAIVLLEVQDDSLQSIISQDMDTVCNETDDESQASDTEDGEDVVPYIAEPLSPGPHHVPLAHDTRRQDRVADWREVPRIPLLPKSRTQKRRIEPPKTPARPQISGNSSRSRVKQTSHEVKHIPLPVTSSGKARRIISNNRDIWSTITMRSDVQFINSSEKYLIRHCSMPGDTSYHVEDVCVLAESVVIVGYGRSEAPEGQPSPQIKTFSLNNVVDSAPPSRICLEHRPHCSKGVKSLAAVHDTSFLSGGYDKRINLWTLSPDDEFDFDELKVFFKKAVDALSYVSTRRTVLAASGKCIKVFDLERPTDVEYKISQSVHHIHPSAQLPDIVVLEVDDLDEQIHVFDRRTAGFGTKAAIRFGYRGERPEDRYTKGSLQQCYFSRGYSDGTVMLWDFRNASDVIVKLQTNRDKPVVHTMFSAGDLVAFGTNVVSVYEKVV